MLTAPTHTTPFRPHRTGEIGQVWHTFPDFDMPRTIGLFAPNGNPGAREARVYTPNPWVPTEVRIGEWYHLNGRWQRSGGIIRNIEIARRDYARHFRDLKWVPQDVIAAPLNPPQRPTWAWDEWAFHFSHTADGFYHLIRIYNNEYPRKAN